MFRGNGRGRGSSKCGRASRTVYHTLWYCLSVMMVRTGLSVCWCDLTCRTISHTCFCFFETGHREEEVNGNSQDRNLMLRGIRRERDCRYGIRSICCGVHHRTTLWSGKCTW